METNRLNEIRQLLSQPLTGRWSRWRHKRAVQALVEDASPEARELLCRAATWDEHPMAREAALVQDWAPNAAAERALFYFLTDQMTKYEALDFDHSLLGTVRAALPQAVRQRVADRIRASGRPEWLGVLHDPCDPQRLSMMTLAEWDALASVLAGQHCWEQIWKLLFQAPFVWAVPRLRELQQSGWRPKQKDDLTTFRRLQDLMPEAGAEPELLPKLRFELSQTGQQNPSVAFSPNRPWLAVAGGDSAVRLFGVPKGGEEAAFHGHDARVSAVAFSPDGQWLASGSDDKTVRLWQFPSGREAAVLQGHVRGVLSVIFSPDGQWLATGGSDDTVRLWEVAGGREIAVFRNLSGTPDRIAFSPDGQWLATASATKPSIFLWEIPGGRRLAEVWHKYLHLEVPFALSPNGHWLATAGPIPTARLWEANGAINGVLLAGHELSVTSLAFSPDGCWLATGSRDDTVRLWEVPGGREAVVLRGHEKEVTRLVFSPDGRLLATGSSDGSTRLWEMRQGTPLGPLPMPSKATVPIAFSPDSRWLAIDGSARNGQVGFVSLWQVNPAHTALASWTHDDFNWAIETGDAISDPHEKRWWRLLEWLLRHKFRFDVQVGEATQGALDQFDIELSEPPKTS